MSSEVPFEDFFEMFMSESDTRPMLITARMGRFTPRRFRKAVRKFCRHFGIPNSLTSLIAIAGQHDYELVAIPTHLLLYRVDSPYGEITFESPAMLHAALSLEASDVIVHL